MDKRSQKVITEDFKTKITGNKKNITPLTSKIECGLCQNVFWRSTSVTGKTPKVYWNCSEYVQRGRKTKNARSPKGEKKSKYHVADSGCDNVHIKESDMDHLIYELAQKIYARSKNNILSVATSILRQIMDDTSELDHQEKVLNDELYKMKSSREILLDKYLEGKIEDDIYSIKDSNLKDQMTKLEDELKMLYNKKSTISDKENRFHDLENELEAIADYDLSVDNMKNHIEKVIVYPSYMMFYFDIFDSVKVEIEKINYRKMEFHICL